MATGQAAGGYDVDFVGDPPTDLSCPICLLPFRDPHILSCCGAKYCEPCIAHIKEKHQPCPICKQTFTSIVDKNDQRKVLNLKVYCSRKKDGCVWEGELRHLDNHECVLSLVQCRQCGGRVPSSRLAEHELDDCPKQPKELAKFKVMMEERYEKDIAAIKEKFEKILHEEREKHEKDVAELKKQISKAHEYEAKLEQEKRRLVNERRALATRTREQEDHKSVMMELSKQVQQYEAKMTELRDLLINSLPLPDSCELIMTNYLQHKKAKDSWYSPPVFSGPLGYKICLRVDASGTESGAGKYVSVYVHLMKGDHDKTLKWPFQGVITVQLLNQKMDQRHVEWTAHFDHRAAAYGSAQRVHVGDVSRKGWGYQQFISHTVLETPTRTHIYHLNDYLKWRVAKIVVHSV